MRKNTKEIRVGAVRIGGTAPISIQSMCNTDTKDVESTAKQILAMESEGVDIVRIAINNLEDAQAIPKIKEKIHVPLIADIQFDYQLALYAVEYGIDGLRLNPGNIGENWKIEKVVNACKEKGISIRVGVNSGSVKQEFLDQYNGVNAESICYSALEQIKTLESFDFHDIKVSLKSSDVRLSVEAYRRFSEMSDYPLHLGITEAGPSFKGTIKSAIGMGSLLLDGIGDTIRVSLTADPVEEVKVAKEILKSLDLRQEGINLISCPTCARTKIDLIPLVEEAEKRFSSYTDNLKIAIMGCIVNGPGEAKEADYGITGGNGKGVVFKKGEIVATVKEEELLDTLFEIIESDRNEQHS
ncbi:flavodoxin-dependent (E)-4-hydroxy-3-methylbut-2-enyl-diphosphate synthase [Peptoniphilus sp. KCTC 25270]|uniref:flavodoxin-dependent (E)-4-hydroxy-3-methylbut-2-enyl-diphosphate synthase n=1 Tax=Peptoniphilus sp. KCTC 25270 TaxID=2897414 RepID=UPI001E486644|nr:flavodoxin-dependent (E)-4-hydroxy-3-methylbut-2-enyl-diphosphate synthase [Peptoniphilus sp. KCTC 25270]MCD1146984.1 flavodoxin-dependent (E)-4-hydroxy-3-methylbut-2-enyl-diphosphate synthase [Peptoniphilus sp. KCTC 25270]